MSTVKRIHTNAWKNIERDIQSNSQYQKCIKNIFIKTKEKYKYYTAAIKHENNVTLEYIEIITKDSLLRSFLKTLFRLIKVKTWIGTFNNLKYTR